MVAVGTDPRSWRERARRRHPCRDRRARIAPRYGSAGLTPQAPSPRRRAGLLAGALAVLVLAFLAVRTIQSDDGPERPADARTRAVNTWMERNRLPEAARPGAELVVEVGCLECHVYLGAGVGNFGAPGLDRVGADRRKNVDYFRRYVENPRNFANDVMPVYGDTLTHAQLTQIARFLEASRGDGSPG